MFEESNGLRGGAWGKVEKVFKAKSFVGRIVLSIGVLSLGKRMIEFREAVFTQQFCLGLGFYAWQKVTYTRMSRSREPLLSYALDF